MAKQQRNLVTAVMGVSAGLAPYLPTVVCPGGACASCFACIGSGAAMATALVTGFIARKCAKPRVRGSTRPG
jgi:hypothetical protein